METAFNASIVVLVILYTVLVMAYARVFARGPGGAPGYVRPVLVATVAVHMASIALRSAMVGSCPLGSAVEVMALVAFSISITYLVIELRIGERCTGVFAITPAFLLQAIAAVSLLSLGAVNGPQMGLVSSLHAFAAIVGFSGVALCSVYGILYLALYGVIKRGKFVLYYRRIPPLETLSEINLVNTEVALGALTLTVGLGLAQYFGSEGSAVSLGDPVVVLTAALWLLYGGGVVARRVFGLGGKRLAYTTVLGLVLMLAVLSWGVVAERFHG